MNTVYSAKKIVKITSKYVNNIDPYSNILWKKINKIEKNNSDNDVIIYDSIPVYNSKGRDNVPNMMKSLLSSAAIIGIPTGNEVEDVFKEISKKNINYGFDSLLVKDNFSETEKYNIIYIK